MTLKLVALLLLGALVLSSASEDEKKRADELREEDEGDEAAELCNCVDDASGAEIMHATLATESALDESEDEDGTASAPSKKRSLGVSKVKWRKSKSCTERCKALRSVWDSKGVGRPKWLSENGGWVFTRPDPAFLIDPHWNPEPFCVPDIGIWVPHEMFPNLCSAPPCPTCGEFWLGGNPTLYLNDAISECTYPGSHEYVDTSSAKWIGTSALRLVHGMHKCWLLDTKTVRCTKCKSSFRCTNPDSVKHLPPMVRAKFGIYMTSRCAVDSDLAYYCVDNWDTDGAKLTSRKILSWHLACYYEDCLIYWGGHVSLKEAEIALAERVDTLDSYGAEYTTGEDARSNYELDLLMMDSNLDGTILALEDEIKNPPELPFLHRKNGMERGHLDKIGPGKAKKLSAAGVTSITKLANVELSDGKHSKLTGDKDAKRSFATANGWRRTAKKYMADWRTGKRAELAKLRTRKAHFDASSLPAAGASSDLSSNAEDTSNAVVVPEPFPDPIDWGFVPLSAALVDTIALSMSESRRAFDEAQLLSATGEIMSLDWTYKMVKKLCVFIPGSRISYKPFEGFVSVMNEYSEIVWYGYVMKKETIGEIEADLIALKKHLDSCDDPTSLGGSTVSVSGAASAAKVRPAAFYIDNCCNLRRIMQEIFPGTPILLDMYHWLARWDNCIAAKKTDPEYHRFMGRMRCAVLVCDSLDWAAGAKLVAEQEKPVCNRFVRPLCKKFVPEAAKLRELVKSVVDIWIAKDGATMSNAASNGQANAKTFFNYEKFSKVYTNQMSHVCRSGLVSKSPSTNKNFINWDGHKCDGNCKSCLSDPAGRNMNYEYPSYATVWGTTVKPSRKFFTGRSSSQHECMHLHFLKRSAAYKAAVVGARKMAALNRNFYRKWNVARSVEKKGAMDMGTNFLDTPALVNSWCVAANAPLQFKDLPVVTTSKVAQGRKIGFSLYSSPGPNINLGPHLRAQQSAVEGRSSSVQSSSGQSSSGQSSSGQSSSSSSNAAHAAGAAAAAAMELIDVLLWSRKRRRRKARGCGRCEFRCFLVKLKPGSKYRPVELTDEDILQSDSMAVHKACARLRCSSMANYKHYYYGTGLYEGNGVADADRDLIDASVMQYGYSSFDEFYDAYSVDDSDMTTESGGVVWGNEITCIAIAMELELSVNLLQWEVQDKEARLISTEPYVFYDHPTAVDSIELLFKKAGDLGSHYDILEDVQDAEPAPLFMNSGLNAPRSTEGRPAGAKRTKGIQSHKLSKSKTGYSFLGEESGLGSIYYTPFSDGDEGKADRELLQELMPEFEALKNKKGYKDVGVAMMPVFNQRVSNAAMRRLVSPDLKESGLRFKLGKHIELYWEKLDKALERAAESKTEDAHVGQLARNAASLAKGARRAIAPAQTMSATSGGRRRASAAGGDAATARLLNYAALPGVIARTPFVSMGSVSLATGPIGLSNAPLGVAQRAPYTSLTQSLARQSAHLRILSTKRVAENASQKRFAYKQRSRAFSAAHFTDEDSQLIGFTGSPRPPRRWITTRSVRAVAASGRRATNEAVGDPSVILIRANAERLKARTLRQTRPVTFAKGSATGNSSADKCLY